jgi:hypothetical protein
MSPTHLVARDDDDNGAIVAGLVAGLGAIAVLAVAYLVGWHYGCRVIGRQSEERDRRRSRNRSSAHAEAGVEMPVQEQV